MVQFIQNIACVNHANSVDSQGFYMFNLINIDMSTNVCVSHPNDEWVLYQRTSKLLWDLFKLSPILNIS